MIEMKTGSKQEATLHLGQELKQWEKLFAASNNGRKPTRQDIKQDPVIAAKYKEYQSVRDSHQDGHHPSKKRRLESDQTSKVAHETKSSETPSKRQRQQNPDVGENYENDPPTPGFAFIGPTPQKDGHVLGIFDLIPGYATPSKQTNQAPQPPHNRDALGALDPNKVISTPSKSLKTTTETSGNGVRAMSATPVRHLRTPQSSAGKRFLLSKFVTPSKQRHYNNETTPQSREHSHTLSSTPAFLKRITQPLPLIEEDDEPPGNINVLPRPGFKRGGFTRSLSSMIAELRQAEEDRLDEELELFNEMEHSTGNNAQPLSGQAKQDTSTTLVEDSQVKDFLDPDGSDLLDGAEQEQNQSASQPSFWKKKGPKRKTRKVIMKPRAANKPTQPTPASTTNAGVSGGTRPNVTAGENMDNEVDELDHSAPPPKKRKTKNDTRSEEHDHDHDSAAQVATAPSTENAVRKTARKISATAHANFCRLKIRSSKGAKAASAANAGRRGGAGGRWGKRR